jgi:hypothetical protein
VGEILRQKGFSSDDEEEMWKRAGPVRTIEFCVNGT